MLANTQEAKRQAIITKLTALSHLQINDHPYLAKATALQVVEEVMYPNGIPTKAAYEKVTKTTEKACAYLGYGQAVALTPSQVSLSQQGWYFPKLPMVQVQMVLDELENAGISATHPQQQYQQHLLWNKVSWKRFNQAWHTLTPAQQEGITKQVEAIVIHAGWTPATIYNRPHYIKPLEPNLAKAEAVIQQQLANGRGLSILVKILHWQLCLGAYGRRYNDITLPPALTTLLSQQLTKYGYNPVPENGAYVPAEIQLPADADKTLPPIIANLPTYETDRGKVLLLNELSQGLQMAYKMPALSPWQLMQLLNTSQLADTLQQLGWQTQSISLRAKNFPQTRPERGNIFVICRQIRISHHPDSRIHLADGFPVHAPTVLLDPKAETIVYLEMVGAKQAIRANWAALAGKKMWSIAGKIVQLDGMKAHIRLTKILPCGWYQLVLLHKQASLREASPETPFYLLDDEQTEMPPLFYSLLNRMLAIPIMPAWSNYLWQAGKQKNIIQLLNEGQGQGIAGWRVLPEADIWAEIIKVGLQEKRVTFN